MQLQLSLQGMIQPEITHFQHAFCVRVRNVSPLSRFSALQSCDGVPCPGHPQEQTDLDRHSESSKGRSDSTEQHAAK